MADFYRYTANKDPFDGTRVAIVEKDDDGEVVRQIERGGDPVELSEDEVARLRERFVLTKASEEAAREAAESSGQRVQTAAQSGLVGSAGGVSVEESDGPAAGSEGSAAGQRRSGSRVDTRGS